MLYQPTPQYHSPAIIFQESQRQDYNIVVLHNQPKQAYRNSFACGVLDAQDDGFKK
jgi:hypothetical protein